MKLSILSLIGLVLFLCSCDHDTQVDENESENIPKEISFYTPDSIQIIGDLYELDKKGSTILLFHQGGSNARAEYGSIIPKLIERGFNVIATDQRVGGQTYGGYNRTLAKIPTNSFGDGYTYCDAYNNLESALDYVIDLGFTGDKLIWGSSYSASLAIQLASKRQGDISGVLAFSPATGGSLRNCLPSPYLESIEVPLIILKPQSEMDSESSARQFELAYKYDHQTYISENGVHGSSMLVMDRTESDVDETWEVVYSFLNEFSNN